jgi:hypothetical protein
MIHRGRLASLRLVIAGLLLLCSLLGQVRAQAPSPDGIVPFAGTQIFRRIVLSDLCKLVPVSSVAEVSKNPVESLVIIFGETESLPEVGITGQWLKTFRGKLGAVMIASDRADQGFLTGLHLSISGDLIHQQKDAYLQREECPLIIPKGPGHPIFKGIHKGLATNQPSYIERLDQSLHTLASFTSSCYSVRTGKAPRGAYLVGAEARSPNPVLALAGHGIFLNEMMAQPDNDNFAFAQNCIDWLTDGGKRKHVLMVEEGRIQAKFDVPLTVNPAMPIPSSSVVNKLLRGLEEENFFNRLLVALIGRDRLLRIVLLFLSAGLLVFGLSRLVRARYRPERGVPLLAGGVRPAESDSPLMLQRERELVQGGNLWEAARGLARSCFDKEPWQGQADQPPRIIVAGWWRHQRLARQVRQLWELAYGRMPLPVSPRMLARIAASVDEVRAALADGTMRFADPPS